MHFKESVGVLSHKGMVEESSDIVWNFSLRP